MTVAIRCCLLLSMLVLATGCSPLRIKLSGDSSVRYQAAWTDNKGNHTESGAVPKLFKFKDENVVGWFRNLSSSGEFRVRVYQGWSLLVDETSINSAQRITVEKKGDNVSVSR
jgi:hypothetical protein